MRNHSRLLLASTILSGMFAARPLGAQLAKPNGAGVAMGHLHLNASDPEAQKALWVDYLGAVPAKLGPRTVYLLPGVIVVVNKADPTGGSVGSVINHLGLKVRDLKPYLAKAEAAHVQIVSQTEKQAMLLVPGDIRLELTEDAASTAPVAHHHVHFYVPDVAAAQQWYATTFGAVPGKRGKFDAADLPGANLSFTHTDTPLAGTKGRAVDHIGFEVKNLENFSKKLAAAGTKFDIPYRQVPELGIAIAFFTDPWGTYIELTEGLDKVSADPVR